MVLDFGNEVEPGESNILVDKLEVGTSFDVDLTWKINQENCLLQIQEPAVNAMPLKSKTIVDDGRFAGAPSHALIPQIDALLLTAKTGRICKLDGAQNEFITVARKDHPVVHQTKESQAASIGAIVMVFRATGFFTPHDVVVQPGEKVVWIYADGANEPHSVTSGACHGNDCSGGGQAFNSGPTLTKPGQRFEHVFTKSGTFPYHCDLHLGSMQGTVIVKP
ncbi:MAG: cupredoxin domain-containing protein [Nitrospirales bacterium]